MTQSERNPRNCPPARSGPEASEDVRSQLAKCRLPADPQLIALGWQQRTIADSRMIQDATEAYREAGFEVRLTEIDITGLPPDCEACKTLFQYFKMIYTRKTPTQ